MSDKTTKGTRMTVLPNGFLSPDTLTSASSYGRAKVAKYAHTPACWWQIRAPDGSGCSLNPAVHTVTEHEDGTITVMPSIVTDTWHGWLTKGEFRSV
jgi:hypothetical protein